MLVAHSELCQIYKKERFAKIVNNFQPFTIFSKSSIVYFISQTYLRLIFLSTKTLGRTSTAQKMKFTI